LNRAAHNEAPVCAGRERHAVAAPFLNSHGVGSSCDSRQPAPHIRPPPRREPAGFVGL